MSRSRRLEIVVAGDDKGAQRTFDAVERRAGGVGAKMRRFGAAAAAGFAVAGAGAAALAAGAFKAGEKLDQAYDTIRVGTGATGAAFEDLKTTFREVAKRSASDVGDIGIAIADLNTRTGATGAQLETLAHQSLNLARITGGDLSAQIAASTRVFGDWGVTIAEQPKVMDELFRASQMSGAEFETLAQQVVQFGSPLRNMGFSLEESISLFGQFEKTGVNIETSMAGMKQAVGNFADEGIDPMQGFQQVLADVEAGTFTMTDAIDIFGKRAAPDMFAALQEGKFNLDEFMAGMVNGSDTINAAAKDTESFGEKWQRIKNRVLVGLEPVASKVFDGVAQAMDRVGPYVDRIGEWFAERLPGWIEVARGWLEDHLVPAFEGVVEWVRTNWPQISSTVTGVMDQVGQIVSDVVDLVSTLWANFGDNILDHVQRIWPHIQNIIGGALDVIAGVVHTVTSLIKGDWGEVWEGIKQIFSGAWQAMTGLVGLQIEQIKTYIALGWEIVRGIFGGVWQGIAGFFAGVWGGITGTVRRGVGIVHGAVSGAWSLIRRVTTGAWSAVRNSISSVLNGITRAVRGSVNVLGDVWGRIKDIFLAPVNWVIRNVINRFIGAINRVSGALGLSFKINPLGEISTGGKHYERPDGRHRGGVIGDGGGSRLGRTGGLRSDEEMIVAQKGEGVLPRSVMDRLGPEGFWSLMKGRMPAADLSERMGELFPREGFSLNPVDIVKGAAGWVVDRVRQAIAAVARPMVEGALGLLDTIPFGGRPTDIAVGGARKLGDLVLDWIAGVEDNLTPSLQRGAPWQELWAVIQGQFPNAWKSSDYRPGSITNSGNLSRHATGNAIDIGLGPSPGPGTLKLAKWIADNYSNSVELIHTPLGFGIKNGSRVAPYAQADHYDHVHWAMRNGGMGTVTGPAHFSVEPGVREDFAFAPHSKGGMASLVGPGGLSPKDAAMLAEAIVDAQARRPQQIEFADGSRAKLVTAGAAEARRLGLPGAPPDR